MKPDCCVWRGAADEEQKVLRAQGAEVNHVGGVMTSAESGAALCSHLLVNISQRNEFAWSLETVVGGSVPAADHYKWLGLFSLRITKASEIPSSVPIPHAALLQGQINKCLCLGQKMVQSTVVTGLISDHPLYSLCLTNWIMSYLSVSFITLIEDNPSHYTRSWKSFSFTMASKNQVSTVNKLTSD